MTPEFIEKLKEAFKSLESKPQLMMEAIEIDRKSTITPIWRAFDQDGFHIDMDGEETQEVVFTHPNEEMPLDLEEVDAFTIVILMWYINEYTSPPMSDMTGKIYTREGMRKRVIKERLEKSIDADYKIKIGTHYYGEHQLFNEKNERFGITIWDFENGHGYINNIDWRTNKLATTKHIFFLCAYMKENASKFKHL